MSKSAQEVLEEKNRIREAFKRKVDEFNSLMTKDRVTYEELLRAHSLFVEFAISGFLTEKEQIATLSNIVGRLLKEHTEKFSTT